MNDIDIQYFSVHLTDVLDDYAKQFTITGRTIVRVEHFVDIAKQVVIFRFVTEAVEEST